MNALPTSATGYLIEIYRAYVAGRLPDKDLVIYCSTDLFKLYKEETKNNTRGMQSDFGVTAYYLRSMDWGGGARIKEDPDLAGSHIRFLEDKNVYRQY